MNNSDDLFTVLDETKDETNFVKYASFFYKVSKKFNLVVQAYGIKKWPVGPPHNMLNYSQATFYWLSCCLQKANALLCPLRSNELGHPILHKELTNMLITANTKLQYIIDNNKFK